MSTGRGSSSSPKLEVELNLSPPTRPNSPHDDDASPRNSSSSSSSEIMSVVLEGSSSCVSWEAAAEESSVVNGTTYESGPESSPSMVLVGCPGCLMYVMLSQVDPKCPKCKSQVLLLDFLNIN